MNGECKFVDSCAYLPSCSRTSISAEIYDLRKSVQHDMKNLREQILKLQSDMNSLHASLSSVNA